MGKDENGLFHPSAAMARREQLSQFFEQASRSATAPEDKGTILPGTIPKGAGAGQGREPAPPAKGGILWGHPPELKYFFGRESELEALAGWFDDPASRVMVVYGLPGVGKSSLGSRFVRQVAGSMPELRSFWARLHHWDSLPSIVGHLAEYFTALGETEAADALSDKGGLGPGGFGRAAADALEDERLVVLDDLHTSVPEVVDLVGALFEAMVQRGRGKLLILSRAIIPFYDRRHVVVDGWVRELSLGGLDQESAMKLLELRGHDIGGPGAQRLFDASRGHPLYLELMKVPAAGEPATGDAHAQGTSGSGAPTDRGKGFELDAHGDVAMFLEEEVYSRLSGPERLLLERASAFRYPAAKEAFFVDRKADLTSLSDLVRRCILTESDGLYDMHELLRSYVYRNIPAERKARIHSGAARFYDGILAAMRRSGRLPVRSHAGHREAAEVVHHLVQGGDPASAADFLMSWGPELVRGPYGDEVESSINSILAHEDEGQCTDEVSAALRSLLGDLLTERGQLGVALATYREALLEMKAESALASLPGIDRNGGGSCWDDSGAGPAISGGGEVAEGDGPSFNAGDVPAGASTILRKMALIRERERDFSTAYALLERGVDIAGSHGDTKGLIMNLGGLGWLHWRAGDFPASRRCFEDSMDLLMGLEEMPGRAKELMARGMVSARQGDLEGALQRFESCMELLERNEDLFDIVRIYDNIGDQYFKVLVTISLSGGFEGPTDDGKSGEHAEGGCDVGERTEGKRERERGGKGGKKEGKKGGEKGGEKGGGRRKRMKSVDALED
jgi:tetratricopeptide (TPR) repeat protein